VIDRAKLLYGLLHGLVDGLLICDIDGYCANFGLRKPAAQPQHVLLTAFQVRVEYHETFKAMVKQRFARRKPKRPSPSSDDCISLDGESCLSCHCRIGVVLDFRWWCHRADASVAEDHRGNGTSLEGFARRKFG